MVPWLTMALVAWVNNQWWYEEISNYKGLGRSNNGMAQNSIKETHPFYGSKETSNKAHQSDKR